MVFFWIRFDDARLDTGIFVQLLEMDNDIRAMGKGTEQADVEMVAVLFWLEWSCRCDLAVE